MANGSPALGVYWLGIARRAAKRTAETMGFDSRAAVMIRAAVALAVVAALYYFGSAGGLWDDLVVRVAVISCIALIVPIVFVWHLAQAPAELDAEKEFVIGGLNARITKLETRSRPELSLSDSPGGDTGIIDVWTGQTKYSDLLFTIRNLGEGTLLDVRLELIKIESRLSGVRDLNFFCTAESDEATTISIPRGLSRRFRVARFQPKVRSNFWVAPPDSRERLVGETGRFKLFVRATACSSPHVEGVYLLEIQTGWGACHAPLERRRLSRLEPIACASTAPKRGEETMAAKVLSALLATLPLLGCGNAQERQEWAGWLQNVSQQMRSQPAMSASPTTAPTHIGVTCFGRGGVASGMNKICYYDCMGSPAAITIGSAEICPLTIIH